MDQKAEPVEQGQKDRPFNPWRRPLSERVKAIVGDVTKELQNYEKYFKLRQRRRRKTDQQTFEATVSAIACDLIHRELTAPGGWVAVSLSKEDLSRRGRYRAPALNKGLRDILKNMTSPEMGFAVVRKGYPGPFGNARRTTVQAGHRLLTRIEDHGVTLADLARTKGGEVIILRGVKAEGQKRGPRLDYEDTDQTRQYRREVEEINERLDVADIQFASFFEDGLRIDETDRRLTRVFNNGNFREGGRLFGGFWMDLKKEVRLERLVIEAEPVVSLDYSQMAPKILYGEANKTPPGGDAYLLPSLEEYRSSIKQVFNAALYADEPLTKFPKGTREDIPRRISFHHVLQKMLERHHEVKDLFFTGIGMHLMFKESEILIDVLLELKARGIVALPVHDAVIVGESHEDTARSVMEEVFFAHTGVQAVIETEGNY